MTQKVENWEEMKIGRETDKCPRCKTGQLVYSQSNIGLRPGSLVEYFFCLTCEMNTVAGRTD